MSQTLRHDTRPKTKPFQVLLRLPDDVAARFVQVVKPGKRNSYLLDLLRRDLDRESYELEQAALALTLQEAKDEALHDEDASWLSASLLADDDKFDAAEFERQYKMAQQGLGGTPPISDPTTKARTVKSTAKKASRKAVGTRKSLQPY